MNERPDLIQLRELFLEASQLETTRTLAIVVSAALAVLVLWLLRHGKLREEYTPIWLGVSVSLLIISFRLDFLRVLTRAIGAWTPSSTVFFLGELFLMAICLNYAVRLSKMSLMLKNLSQELAILRTQFETLRSGNLAGGGNGDGSTNNIAGKTAQLSK